MDKNGSSLENNQRGEIAIQGANVFRGYENNPEANARAFVNGWFRTGDQGYLDEDCYLHLTGRMKDIIIRGGENIAPHEVDEVLLRHPTVAAAVTFATGIGFGVVPALRVSREKSSSGLRPRAFSWERG